MSNIEIGVLGGSGFYNLLENAQEKTIQTEYGDPSDKVVVGEYAGKSVAFLPRHGQDHNFPPHLVPYRANLATFKKLGVKYIIGPCAAGSLQVGVKPGEFVILDQFVDRTKSRKDTIFEGPKGRVAHLPMNEPYCSNLRKLAIDCCQELDIQVHQTGTVVVIEGPRFSTVAESRWFSSQGWEVINMTQYPECYLAREMGMCYVGIALITDHDVGLEGHSEVKSVTMEDVIKVFNENNEKVKKLIFRMIEKLEIQECGCHSSAQKAIVQ
ncbi:MAG: S-methyl-5'-thioadenosine phosphorylase [bacterium]